MESQLTKEKNESWRQFNFQNEYGIVVWFGQVWIAACQLAHRPSIHHAGFFLSKFNFFLASLLLPSWN
jgi:hypothetical protein